MPDASLTCALAGPANGKPGWYGLDKNNFGPRLALAYSPEDGLGAKLLGKGSVFRAGFAVLYDHYGADMITNLDSTGSPGLATPGTQRVNTDLPSAPRYANGLPALPKAPQGAFPFTPPTIVGGLGAYVSISPDLVAPYSYVMNASYCRELPGKMTIELGYLGRIGHRGLEEEDTLHALTPLKDPAFAQNRAQAGTQSVALTCSWSHWIDSSSAPEGGAGASGAVIQDSFNPGGFRGPSDFDARHQINANLLYELPFGTNKMFLSHAPRFVNQIVGGWQISMLSRYRSGLPTTITAGGLYPTNYLTSALVILSPGTSAPASGVGLDQKGRPSIFRSTNAANSYIEQYPGAKGTRGILRLAPPKNFHISGAKSFALP